MSKLFYHTISDTQWEIIEPHLPKPKSTGRPTLNSRIVFEAIFWVLDSGAKWRYIPKEFGNRNSIYHKFRQWSDASVFEKILKSLVEDCRKFYLVEMDSTFCKVHQHAAGARKILGNQNIGTSRGGKTTKIHALVNEHFQLIGVDLTGGEIHDSKFTIKLLSKITLTDKKVWLTRLFAPNSFAIIFLKKRPSPVFPTSQMPS